MLRLLPTAPPVLNDLTAPSMNRRVLHCCSDLRVQVPALPPKDPWITYVADMSRRGDVMRPETHAFSQRPILQPRRF